MDGGLTPEELETLLEDAILLGDADAVTGLFQPGGVLVVDTEGELRGQPQVPEAPSALRRHRPGYLATPRRVVRVRDMALMLGPDVVNLANRGNDGTWRYAICVLLPCPSAEK